MEENIEVKEKYSNKWTPALFISLLVALIAFLIYLNLDDVLWTGIFRLLAFISLSLGIFCMLKVMEGSKTFGVEIRDDLLLISYLKNKEVIDTEKLKIEDIKSIYREPHRLKFLFSDYHIELSGNHCFKVEFHNEEESDMALFKFGGRVLTVDEKSGQKLEQFLKRHDLFS